MPNEITLDDASQHLGISRRVLSSSLSALGMKTTRGAGGRAYLSQADMARVEAFRAGDAKSNPMYGSGNITYASVPQPQQMPRNTKNYAKEGFAGDPTLYKAINYCITNGAAIPPKLYTDATMQDVIEKHPLLDFLEQPNPEQSGVDYREAVIGWLLIAGNSFQYAIRAAKSGPPGEVWVLPPEMVHPVTEKPRGVIGYDFDAFEEKNKRIPPELICHLKFWNPNSEEFGLSPIEPAAILIDQNAAARKWNLSVLQNGGRMDGAWTTPVAMGKNERDDLERKMAGKYRGYSNAGKAPVLDAGLTFNPTAYTPTELDWLESLRRNEAGIANIVNIPPPLIGDTSASTYNNMGEAKAASYTEEIFPVLDRIYAGWRRWLQPMYGLKGAYLYYDKQSVEVVQQVIQAQKDAQFKRAVSGWLQGAITMNEAREICGLPPVAGGDVFRFGAVLVRLDDLNKYAEQSMAEPAAPPMPMPEPLNVPAPDEAQQPPPKDKARFTPAEKAALVAVRERLRTTKAHAPTTHLLWECDASACAWCLENDGAIVAEGDAFPNGASSPDDSHRFCKCNAYELALPDDVDPDEHAPSFLIAVYAVGYMASRHARDVAAQQAQQQAEEDDSEGDFTDPEYAKALQRAERRQRREEYQRFMQEVL